MNSLILTGGGYKGAYQYGVLQALDKKNKLDTYDSVYGTSVGALNGLYVAFPGLRTKIDAIWYDVIFKGKRFHRKSLMSYLGLPFGRDGLYTNVLGKEIEKMLSLGCIPNKRYYCTFVDLKTKVLYYLCLFDESGPTQLHTCSLLWDSCCDTFSDCPENPKLWAEMITGSTSIPILFSPVKTNLRGKKVHLVDGGVRDIAPLRLAIDNLQNYDSITVISCSPLTEKCDKEYECDRVDRIAQATLDTLTHEILMNDINICKFYNSLVESPMLDKKFIQLKIAQPQQPLMSNSLEPSIEELKKAYYEGLNLDIGCL